MICGNARLIGKVAGCQATPSSVEILLAAGWHPQNQGGQQVDVNENGLHGFCFFSRWMRSDRTDA